MPTSAKKRVIYLTCCDEEIAAIKKMAKDIESATGMDGAEVYRRALRMMLTWTKTPECKEMVEKRPELKRKKDGAMMYRLFVKPRREAAKKTKVKKG